MRQRFLKKKYIPIKICSTPLITKNHIEVKISYFTIFDNEKIIKANKDNIWKNIKYKKIISNFKAIKDLNKFHFNPERNKIAKIEFKWFILVLRLL